MLKKILFSTIFIFFIFVNAVEASSRQQILSINILKKGDSIKIESLSLSYGYATKNSKEYSYLLRTLDNQEKIINELKFNIRDFEAVVDPDWFDPETGEQIYVPNEISDFPQKESLTMPFNTNIKYITILDSQGKEEYYKVAIEELIDIKILNRLKENEQKNKEYTKKKQEKQKKDLEKIAQKEARESDIVSMPAKTSQFNYLYVIFFLIVFVEIILGIYIWKKRKSA